MPRGSKLNRPSTLSAIRTSWVDSFTFERYVFPQPIASIHILICSNQDREAEPRFSGPPTDRGGYSGPAARGGFGGGYGGGGMGAGGGGGGGRQIYVSNVCFIPPHFPL
jgi:hypothetical protein